MDQANYAASKANRVLDMLRKTFISRDSQMLYAYSNLIFNQGSFSAADMASEKGGQEGPKNPPYIDMIVAAIRADASRTGTSKQVCLS